MIKKKEKEQAYLLSPLNNPMPNYAVYVLSPLESTAVRLISFVIGGLVGLVFYGNLFMRDGIPTMATYISNTIFFVIVGVCAVVFLMPMYKKSRKKKRADALKKQFRDMLESLAASFSSGSNVQMSFEAAAKDLKMQYSSKEYICMEMDEILAGIHQNVSIEEMLRNFGERSGNEDVESFADVFSVCYRKGGNMNSVIQRTHDVISDKMAVADEIETKLTSNKLQHNIMSIMPIAIVAMLRLTNRAFAENFATLTGVLVNTMAIGIFVGAYIYGNKIVEMGE